MDTMTYPEYVAATLKKADSRKEGYVQATVDSMLRGLSDFTDSPRIYTIDDNGQATLVRKTGAEWLELTMDVVMHKIFKSAK